VITYVAIEAVTAMGLARPVLVLTSDLDDMNKLVEEPGLSPPTRARRLTCPRSGSDYSRL
jgi:hypothetical protein